MAVCETKNETVTITDFAKKLDFVSGPTPASNPAQLAHTGALCCFLDLILGGIFRVGVTLRTEPRARAHATMSLPAHKLATPSHGYWTPKWRGYRFVCARAIQRHVRGWLIRRWRWLASYYPRFPPVMKARWAARFRHDYGLKCLNVQGGVEGLNAAHYAVLYSSPVDLSEALRFGANPFQRDVHGQSVFDYYASHRRRTARHDAMRGLLVLSFRHHRAAVTLQAWARSVKASRQLAAVLCRTPALRVLPAAVLVSHVAPMAVDMARGDILRLRAPSDAVMGRVQRWRTCHPYGWVTRCWPAWGLAGCPADVVEAKFVRWRGYPWEKDVFWPRRMWPSYGEIGRDGLPSLLRWRRTPRLKINLPTLGGLCALCSTTRGGARAVPARLRSHLTPSKRAPKRRKRSRRYK